MPKFKLIPTNKQIVVKDLEADNKVGGLYIPSTAHHGTYAQAILLAVAADVDEKFEAVEGDRIIYDTIGAVDHRVGNQGFRTVNSKNVVSIVRPVEGDV